MRSELILFTSGDLTLSVPVTPEEDTVWLSQAQMGELYGRDVSVISRHINDVFKEGEVAKEGNLHFLQIAGSDRPTAFTVWMSLSPSVTGSGQSAASNSANGPAACSGITISRAMLFMRQGSGSWVRLFA